MASTNVCILFVALTLLSTDVMVTSVNGAKILFIPSNMNSHVLFFTRLAADLTQLGHVTRVLAPSNAHVPVFVAEAESGGNFSYTKYPVDGDEPFVNSRYISEVITRLALSQSAWEKFSGTCELLTDIFNAQESDCVRLLDNLHLMEQIRSGGFQFAVIDAMTPQCHLPIPYSMRVPYAILTVPIITWMYRVPRFPSFVSDCGLGYTDRMTLVQRLTTFVSENLFILRLLSQSTEYVARLAPDRPLLSAYQLLQQV